MKDVILFDLYEGEKMEEGKKLFVFFMIYFDVECILIDEEVIEVYNCVLIMVEEKFGVELCK